MEITIKNITVEELKARGYLFLNEVYELLGLPRTRAGQQTQQ